MEKFRSNLRVARHSFPQSSVQERLGQLSTLNGDLTRLLNGQQLTTASTAKTNPTLPIKFLIRDYHQAEELYEFIRKGYACNCDNPHIANFRLHQPSKGLLAFSDSRKYKWTFNIVFSPLKGKQSECVESLQPCISNDGTPILKTAVVDASNGRCDSSRICCRLQS